MLVHVRWFIMWSWAINLSNLCQQANAQANWVSHVMQLTHEAEKDDCPRDKYTFVKKN